MQPTSKIEKHALAVLLIDQALLARDEEQWLPCLEKLQSALTLIEDSEKALKTLVHSQLGYVNKLQGNYELSEIHFEAASSLSPKSELASIAFTHALVRNNKQREALAETLRFLRLGNAEMYREFVFELEPLEFDHEVRSLIAEAKNLIAKI